MDNEKRAIELIEMASEMSERYYKKPMTAICTAWGRLKTIHPYNGIENITSVARLSYTPRQQRTT